MKHIYLQLALALVSFELSAQNGQLLNSGFENWENRTISEHADDWFDSNQFGINSVFRSTDSQDGMFSAECRSLGPDESIGYVGLGELIAFPSAGIPYSSNFNTISFQYKSEFETADSIYVHVVRFLNGSEVGEYETGAAFDSHSDWTAGTFEIPDGTQDSVFIAFLTGSLMHNDRNSLNSWFRIDKVELFDDAVLQPALPNFSFENWTPDVTEEPVNWFTMNPLTFEFLPEGTIKTGDAHSGNFAALLTTQEIMQFGNPVSYAAVLSLSDPAGNNGQAGIPYSYSPTLLTGWYKFTPSLAGSDGASAVISFYNNGNLCGGGVFSFQANASYTQFSIPLTYTQVPDEIHAYIYSGENNGSMLKIDDLIMSGGNVVGLEEFAKSSLSVYPNPATETVMIKADGNYDWEIVTISGNFVLNGTSSAATEISLTGLTSGTYFVRLKGDLTNDVHKLVVTK